ncbi:hypothetical protein [Paenibacillus contaminans]|uniref:Uncharacterized protein n=1 Tax=Paenibacillus contaminans TaxID=450362 RepID=A0A329LXM9_9BACL|nr:hypothetical protein [Paenibacillus contaminans]RAV11886.1 hypothetical protein DQG23_35490 [Paenibacillus contaminans]
MHASPRIARELRSVHIFAIDDPEKMSCFELWARRAGAGKDDGGNIMSYVVFAANAMERRIVDGADMFGISQLADCQLDRYEAIVIIGSGSIETETALSAGVLDKLWHYVKAGGTLYAEMIGAFDGMAPYA